MDRVAGIVVGAWLLMLAMFWLLAQRRKRRLRSPDLPKPSPTAPANAVVRSQAAPRPSLETPPSLSVTAGAADARWLEPRQSITIAGITIDGGLFYLGRSLPAHSGYGTENALINPALPVARSPGNVSGQGVPYYPNYSTLDPGSRRAYLEWLASARDNPATYIGYVFLYFYGLERRLFLDPSARDHQTIVAEVHRLLETYGANRSFQIYALAFLDAAAALANLWPAKPSIDPEAKPSELPLGLRGAIGTLLKRGEPLPADWALAWYVASPDYTLRTPAVRCFREFFTLYRQRFAAKFPRGLLFRPPRRNLSVRYRAASGTFTATLHGDFETLPDIVSLTAPLVEVDRVVAECTEALDPFSRLIGKNPSARGTLAAELTLPKELLQRPQPGGAVAHTRQRLESLVPMASAMVQLSDLMALLQIEPRSGEKNSKPETVAVAAALENLDFAIEPDPRHGGPIPPRSAEVMIFRQHGQQAASTTPSAEFLAARSKVEISVLVATADGAFDGDEARTAIEQIKAMPGLSEFQRARLFGYLGYLVRNPPDFRAVARLKDRSLAERKALAETAITTAAADGHLDVTEVKVLEKTYKTLGFSKDELYSNLHALGAQDDEPPTVAPATPVRGVPIPPKKAKPLAPRTGITLDKKRIAKIQAETAAVKSILDQVFNEVTAADEEAVATPAPAPIPVVNPTFGGLDDRHASLLSEIVSMDAIDQAAFSDLARKHGLFAGGAMEAINEWSFQRFDEPLLDDGEPIEIARHLIRMSETSSATEHVA